MWFSKVTIKFGIKLCIKINKKDKTNGTKFGYNSYLKINITTYFENLIIRLYVIYIFNTHVKFCTNQMISNIRSINLFLIHNFRIQKLEI